MRCTASLYRRCAALAMSSRGLMPSRSATFEISYFPLLMVFSCESTWRPKMRPPLVLRPTLAVTPLSGTKLPSTWVAPPAVLLNVGSVLKTLSSRILPHWVQHLREARRGRGER